jgi:transposase-like protein
MECLKRMRFPLEVVLVCIRWYAAYPLSLRHIEEMMEERGVSVDHSTISRWALKFLTLVEKSSRRYKRPVGLSWRMDETYIKVLGKWKYLYRAVDKTGDTIDFLLTAKRDTVAATRFFNKAIGHSGIPEKVTMDKSGANKAAMEKYNKKTNQSVIIRQIKYLNNIVEQDHRGVKRITNQMLGFKSFASARKIIAGIEPMHMIRKGQFTIPKAINLSPARQFYAIAKEAIA